METKRISSYNLNRSHQLFTVLFLTSRLGNRWVDKKFHEYLIDVPFAFKKKLNQMRRWEDKQRSLIGMLLVKKALIYFGFEKEAILSVQTTKHGKPFLNDSFSFNISHSSDRIICVSGMHAKLGVDIERIVKIDITEFQHAISEKEYQIIRFHPHAHRQFYKFWSAKEAVVKADGGGLQEAMPNVFADMSYSIYNNSTWYLTEIDWIPRYIGFIACNVRLERSRIALVECSF